MSYANGKPVKQDVRKRLIRSCMKFGDYAEWQAACEQARDEGWTYSQVSRIIWLYHPATWLWVGLFIFIVVLLFFK
jgi:hypothetical protein